MKTRAIALAYLLILALMYLPPYTLLRDAMPLTLYAYWAALSLIALALAPRALAQTLGDRHTQREGR